MTNVHLELDAIFVALAVLLFVFFAIAILVIIDHKAKIPGEERSDLISISGIRRNHPIWAWLVNMFLLWIIISLLVIVSYNLLKPLFAKEAEQRTFLQTVDKEADRERIRHFHNSPEQNLMAQGKQPVCFYCHGDYPHSKRPMVRTLLNFHTAYVGCLTCHVDSKKIPEEEVTFRWLNYSGIEVKGKPYGTDYDPETGNLAETDDIFSKVVAYRQHANGEEELLEITEDKPEAQEFIAIRGELSTQQQGAIKKRFHSIVQPIGRFCTRCHVPGDKEPYIPFKDLGFSEDRVLALTNLNIAGLVQKYKKFYMDMVFPLGSQSSGQEAVVLGEDISLPESNGDMKDDPRSWWRKTFDQPGQAQGEQQ